jgi:hypothetical protein
MGQVIPGPWNQKMTQAEHERIQSLINMLDTVIGPLKALRTKLDELARGQREDWACVQQDLDAINSSVAVHMGKYVGQAQQDR